MLEIVLLHFYPICQNSAGSYVTLSNNPHEVNYSLGNKYRGDARRSVRRKFDCRKPKRLSSRWLAGVKGCFVCEKDHIARTKHSREQVKAVIDRLKAKHSTAMLSVEYLAMIADDLLTGDRDESDEDVVLLDFEDEDEDTAYISQDALGVHRQHVDQPATISFLHGRTFGKDRDAAFATMNSELSLGEYTPFKGIYIDSCANRSYVMSYEQYTSYCREFQVPCRINHQGVRNMKGIGGESRSVGTVMIPVPFNDLNLIIDVKFQIVRDKIPTLLSMKDMLDNGLDISIQNRVVRYKHLSQSLLLQEYFLIHRWKPGDIPYSLYTEAELRKLHRVFGHPSVSSLLKVLKRARPSEMDNTVRETVEEISKSCVPCSINAPKPRRFKITIGTDDLQFNHIVATDIIYIATKPILHLVDEATHYNAAFFLRDVSAKTIWKAILRCWTRAYLGPPDLLRVDEGSSFVSKEFISSAETEGIVVLPTPIESPSTMSHVERYHGPLRSAYKRIRDSLPHTESNADCLQMAVKCVNDTIGPEGLCPTLLVFGSIPRPARTTVADTQLVRVQAIEKE